MMMPNIEYLDLSPFIPQISVGGDLSIANRTSHFSILSVENINLYSNHHFEFFSNIDSIPFFNQSDLELTGSSKWNNLTNFQAKIVPLGDPWISIILDEIFILDGKTHLDSVAEAVFKAILGALESFVKAVTNLISGAIKWILNLIQKSMEKILKPIFDAIQTKLIQPLMKLYNAIQPDQSTGRQSRSDNDKLYFKYIGEAILGMTIIGLGLFLLSIVIACILQAYWLIGASLLVLCVGLLSLIIFSQLPMLDSFIKLSNGIISLNKLIDEFAIKGFSAFTNSLIDMNKDLSWGGILIKSTALVIGPLLVYSSGPVASDIEYVKAFGISIGIYLMTVILAIMEAGKHSVNPALDVFIKVINACFAAVGVISVIKASIQVLIDPKLDPVEKGVLILFLALFGTVSTIAFFAAWGGAIQANQNYIQYLQKTI